MPQNAFTGTDNTKSNAAFSNSFGFGAVEKPFITPTGGPRIKPAGLPGLALFYIAHCYNQMVMYSEQAQQYYIYGIPYILYGFFAMNIQPAIYIWHILLKHYPSSYILNDPWHMVFNIVLT